MIVSAPSGNKGKPVQMNSIVESCWQLWHVGVQLVQVVRVGTCFECHVVRQAGLASLSRFLHTRAPVHGELLIFAFKPSGARSVGANAPRKFQA